MFILCIILTIPFLAFYWRYIDLRNLFLIDVYETRLLFRNIKVPLIGYLVSPLSRVILPILIVIFIEKKEKIYAIVSIVLILIIYLCGSTKSIFIGIIAIIFFYKGNYEKKLERFIKLILLISISGIIFYYLFNNLFFIDTFIRRLFFLPYKLENVYFDFFQNNYTYGMHTFLGEIFHSKNYYGELGIYVGKTLMGQVGMNANVGVLTEGFLSFGVMGIFIAAILICTFFLIMNSLNIDKKYFGIIFVYIYYINTSFLFTLMLTHGLMFLILFSYLFLKDTNKSKINV
ncbi:hypothetical protein [Clostridium perfringens]|uniref:hypothetical protein n=1 Tax=Clostridium perfringens TaxID=1502 RepID=UPI001A2A6ABF|nr:hypothetical protein [Clostridium perfringens]